LLQRAKNKIFGRKYDPSKVEEIAEGATALYHALEANPQLANLNPELAKSIVELNKYISTGVILDIAHAHGFVDDKKHTDYHRSLEKRVASSRDEVTQSIEQSVGYKTAASIIGALGLGIIVLSNIGITGAAIGAGGGVSGIGNLLGIGMFLVSILLFLKKTKL
jgi:hypothetical protein